MTSTVINLAVSRTEILSRIGATDSAAWHHYATATAALDSANGVLYVAMDAATDSGDWEAMLDLANAAGYEGDGHSDVVESGDVTVWRMPIPA
jgi:hypothetical protein